MNEKEPFYISYLKEHLTQRVQSNARYSLRAFAKSIDMDPGDLSRIFSRKTPLSLNAASKILERLSASPTESQEFIESVVRTKREKRTKAQTLPKKHFSALSLDLDSFRIISNWIHYAILEMTFTEGFVPNSREIARRLSVSEIDVQLAIERLLKLGLLTRSGTQSKKTLKKKTSYLKIDHPKTSHPAKRKHQKQVLQKAIHSLENDPIEIRKMTSLTIAIDSSQLDDAKAMIDRFRNRFCSRFTTERRDKVYHLSVSLYPVDRGAKKHRKTRKEK